VKTLILAAAIFMAPQANPRAVILVPQQTPALTAPVPAQHAPQLDTSPKFDIRPDFQGFMKVIPAPSPGTRGTIVLRGSSEPQIQRYPASPPSTGPFRFMPLERDEHGAGRTK
jgi:hypothetical protein